MRIRTKSLIIAAVLIAGAAIAGAPYAQDNRGASDPKGGMMDGGMMGMMSQMDQMMEHCNKMMSAGRDRDHKPGGEPKKDAPVSPGEKG